MSQTSATAGLSDRWLTSSGKALVVTSLGVTQIFAWGSSYYLPTVLAKPIEAETGWPPTLVIGGLSLGLALAGLVSPRIGHWISRFGGRPVLAAGAILLAIGQLTLALAHTIPVYFLAWLIIGVAMGASLYDPAFATLGRLYGQSARSAITSLTLFGGFASTVCWPLSAYLESRLGWRDTCIAYALVQLLVALPLHVLALPREGAAAAQLAKVPEVLIAEPQAPNSAAIFVLLAAVLTISSIVSTVMSVHLLTVLQDRGIALAAAVGLGALVGPSQVGARAIEMAVARFHHPIWTKVASASLVTAGMGLLWGGITLPAIALVLYGGGIGLESIARGTLPLAIFGPAKYPALMGRIARPSLLAQAVAPTIAAGLIDFLGVTGMLTAVLLTSAANLILSVLLFALLRRERARPQRDGVPKSLPRQH